MASNNPFKAPEAASFKLKIALVGPGGSGKTFVALTLANRLAEVNGGGVPALVDTEHQSHLKYAKLFRFDAANLANFDPRRYCAAMNLAVEHGYQILVVDSLSHAWMGTGGMLELVDRFKGDGSGFNAWGKATPIQNQLIDTIQALPIHLICTLRTRTEYVVELDSRGKSVPKKVGVGPVQRDGVEYEFDVIVDIDADHNLAITKARCPALDGAQFLRDEVDHLADMLIAWSSGDDIPPAPAQLPATTDGDGFGASDDDSLAGPAAPTPAKPPRAAADPDDDDPLGGAAPTPAAKASDDPLAEPPNAGGDDPLAEQADDDPLAEPEPPKRKRRPRGKQADESSPWHGDEPPAGETVPEAHSDHETVARLCAMYADVHSESGLRHVDREREQAQRSGDLVKKDAQGSAWLAVEATRELAERRIELVKRLVTGFKGADSFSALKPFEAAIETAVQEGLLSHLSVPMEVVTGARLEAMARAVMTAAEFEQLTHAIDAADEAGDLIVMSDEYHAVQLAVKAAEARVGKAEEVI